MPKKAKKKTLKKTVKKKPHSGVEGVRLLGVNSDFNPEPTDLESNAAEFESDEDNMPEIQESERIENEKNVRQGIVSQSEFTKAYVAEVVNRLVADPAVASQVLTEINAKLDARDAKFLEAVDSEFNEVDVDADAEALTKDLLAG